VNNFIIYRIWMNDNCIYVGRTKQPINARLRGHIYKKPMHRFIDISWVTKIEVAQCKTQADMYLYEIYYINKLKPSVNQDDKAFDELTVEIPELEFVEHKTALLEKWKKDLGRQEHVYFEIPTGGE
jgi:excinuclease UvrABC nuclease subunit